jgi:crotonobetainyl-CoA:carnitine CoA-transferase CaiB-like acyl-CoA transferase
MKSGPLSDLVVLEIADDVAGAFAGKCLADLGARVIKIEPVAGDPLRQVGPFAGGAAHIERGALFLWLNTSKESLVLDTESAPGRSILDRLLERVDAVIVSPAVQRLASLGIDPVALGDSSPCLTIAAISPFGLTGCHAGWKADDLVRTAMAGWQFMSGRPDREPLTTFDTLPSAVTGLAAASAVLMAVHERSHSRKGQLVDISSQEVLALCTAYISTAYSYSGTERQRNGMPFPMTIVPTTDGYLGINVLTQGQWEGLCSFAGLHDLLENPDYATPTNRAAHAIELTERFIAWAADKEKATVFHEGQQWRVPFGFVPKIGEVPELDVHVEREFFERVEHPEAGAVFHARAPFLVRGLDPVARAPLLGEHSSAILESMSVHDA